MSQWNKWWGSIWPFLLLLPYLIAGLWVGFSNNARLNKVESTVPSVPATRRPESSR